MSPPNPGPELKASLPQGMEIIPSYDRSALIWGTLEHFFTTLIYELIVVIAVTALDGTWAKSDSPRR
jgi:Cu/Ag efflux pump CusA